VKRSAYFEPLPSENLAFIFENFVGGFAENAYKDLLKVERITNTERKLIDINYAIANSFSQLMEISLPLSPSPKIVTKIELL